MSGINKKELVPIMKRKELNSMLQNYSDYVVDIGGVSIEEFVFSNYLKDKTIEQIVVKSELDEEFVPLSNRIYDYFSKAEDIDLDNLEKIIELYSEENL